MTDKRWSLDGGVASTRNLFEGGHILLSGRGVSLVGATWFYSVGKCDSKQA